VKQSALIAILVSLVVCALATRTHCGNSRSLDKGALSSGDCSSNATEKATESSLSFGALPLTGIVRLIIFLLIYSGCLALALVAAGYVLNYLSVEPTLKVVFDTAQQRTATAGADLTSFESLIGALSTDQQLALDTAKLTVASVQFSYLTFEIALGALAAAIALGVWTVIAPAIFGIVDSIAPLPSSNGKISQTPH
jgi:hypothetical protein